MAFTKYHDVTVGRGHRGLNFAWHLQSIHVTVVGVGWGHRGLELCMAFTKCSYSSREAGGASGNGKCFIKTVLVSLQDGVQKNHLATSATQ